MADKLKDKFCAYTESFQAKLRRKRGESPRKGPLKLFVNPALELQTAVDELESSDEFRHLIAETRSSFSGDYHGKGEWAWQQAVKNFFRRSGFYNDLFEEKTLDEEVIFSHYCHAFQKREIQITYLAPMEFVDFAEPSMDFGTYQVRRFAVSDLEAILQNRINKIFYPWAVIDIKQLQDYWFLHLTESTSISRLGWIYIDTSQSRTKWASVEYSQYPKVVESALQVLALFDWQADWWKRSSIQEHEQQKEDLKRGWFRFDIPFVLRVDDNWLDSPRGVPDLSRLETESIPDNTTGEEIGTRPLVCIHLDKDETDQLLALSQRAKSLLADLRIQQNDWQFVEIALGYFIKAFFTQGLEQLLWHLTTLEALLGEKGKGVTERLAQRVSSILGKSEHERKAFKKQFKDLYRFRSDLVHGNQFQGQVFASHLKDARDLARRILLWFLHYLDHIQRTFPDGQPVEAFPSREEILMLVEMKKETRARLRRVIEKLPEEFPNVQGWLH